jgi:hypothetical protein
MARPRKNDDMISSFIDRLAEAVAARLGGSSAAGNGSGARNGAAKASKGAVGKRANAGRKLDMSCRVAGCTNKSKGPRFGFICEDHLKKLGKKDQQAARDAWKAKHAR